MADKNYALTFKMSDGTEKKVQFTSPQGDPGAQGKSAYQYAQDGGYAGTESDFAGKLATEWQTKLTGTAGQVVGFDANGNAIAQAAPEGGGSGGDSSIPTVDFANSDTLSIPMITDPESFDQSTLVGDVFMKVSDAVLTLDDFASGFSVTVGEEQADYPPEFIPDIVYYVFDGVLSVGGAFVSVAPNAVGVEIGGISFPESGTYVAVDILFETDISLTIPGYASFSGGKKIDPAYLFHPDWNQPDETQPDSVKNRPFGPICIGDTIVATSENVGNSVSLSAPSESELRTGAMEITSADGEITTISLAENVESIQLEGFTFIMAGINNGANFQIIPKDIEAGTIVLPKGIYLSSLAEGDTVKLHIPGYNFVGYKKIDAMYIPTIPEDKLPVIPENKLPVNEPIVLSWGAQAGSANSINYLLENGKKVTRSRLMEIRDSGKVVYFKGIITDRYEIPLSIYIGDTYGSMVVLNQTTGELKYASISEYYTAEYTGT